MSYNPFSYNRETARGWKTPIPVGDEVIQCSYCERVFPRWYQNQTGPKADPPGRDGYTRLEAHVYDCHYDEHKRAKQRATSRRAYERKKALRTTATS